MVMKMNKNKVMLMGFGSQGTRIASAISAQPDFQLDGICVRTSNVFAHIAHRKGYPIHVPREKDVDSFKKANMTVQGTLSGALPRIDVIVDATPSGVEKMNKNEWYSQYDLKCIFQAGETHSMLLTFPCFTLQLIINLLRMRIPFEYHRRFSLP